MSCDDGGPVHECRAASVVTRDTGKAEPEQRPWAGARQGPDGGPSFQAKVQGAPVEKSREEREGSYRMGGCRGESR